MAKKLKPVPGEILHEEFMKPLGLSMNKLALDLRVPVTRISWANAGASVRYHARGGGIQPLAKRLRGRKLTRAWVSSSKEGIVSKSRNIVNTSSTRPHGQSNFRAPPWSLRETNVLTMMLTPVLSTWVRFVRFNSNLRTPLAINVCSWLSSNSLSPSLMVDLP